MSNDPWDGLGNGNYAKWENVGDEITGDVVGKGKGTDLQGQEVPQIVVRLDDEREVTVTASQAQLRAKLMEARPQVGDRIRIKYTNTEKRDAGKTLKHFEVVVKTGGAKAPVATPAAVAAAADDF